MAYGCAIILFIPVLIVVIYKVMLMLYTISDFSREYEGSVRLIAGSDGVSRAVSGVGILDYELMPGLKNKYQRVNFSPDEIVLSTFLYAKDDPYLITEAVKYLVAKEMCIRDRPRCRDGPPCPCWARTD